MFAKVANNQIVLSISGLLLFRQISLVSLISFSNLNHYGYGKCFDTTSSLPFNCELLVFEQNHTQSSGCDSVISWKFGPVSLFFLQSSFFRPKAKFSSASYLSLQRRFAKVLFPRWYNTLARQILPLQF